MIDQRSIIIIKMLKSHSLTVKEILDGTPVSLDEMIDDCSAFRFRSANLRVSHRYIYVTNKVRKCGRPSSV